MTFNKYKYGCLQLLIACVMSFSGQALGALSESPFPFSGELTNPNSSIPIGYYGQLIGVGAFGWKTGKCSKNVDTNGFGFTIDSGNGNVLNYSGVITGGGSVNLISASSSSPCCSLTPLILSGTLPNNYAGTTTLTKGLVELAKSPGVMAIPGDVVMLNQGSNDELRWMASNQMSPSANLMINSSQGKVNLNGFQDTFYSLRLAKGATLNLGGGGLTVTQLYYDGVKQSAGIYSSTHLPFITGAGQVTILGDSTPLPAPYQYLQINGQTTPLYPFPGQHVALLVTANYYNPSILAKITTAVDAAYQYYATVTGRQPTPLRTYQGLTTVAVVSSTCGAGCSYIGSTGIELAQSSFDVLFTSVRDKNQYDQVVFYELGRNFWFYGKKLEYVSPDDVANITTGFSVFMRFLSMNAAGVAGAPFGTLDFQAFQAKEYAIVNQYLSDPTLTWANTMKLGKSPYGTSTDLIASFLLYLVNHYGDSFNQKFWKAAQTLPDVVTTQDAVNNFITAASIAAGTDLTSLFKTWRWPVQTTQSPPLTIPAIRVWTPTPGNFTFSKTTRVIPLTSTLSVTANVLASDLSSLTNVVVPVVLNGTPVPGDIVLSLDAVDPAIGTQGYLISVSSVFHISAQTDAGAFNGTRTLLQLLNQGLQIGGGMARDWPSYPERSMMVDNGRKYFTPAWIKNKIKELSYLKYNYLHLHLSDDQGFRIESVTVTPTPPFLTKAEVADIIQVATQYHITIVPEFEMPAHMGAILTPALQLKYDNGTTASTTVLDLANDQSYVFIQNLINEYIGLFPGKYWHMGGDEFSVDWTKLNRVKSYVSGKLGNPNVSSYDGFYYFLNWVDSLVTQKGKKLRIWGSQLNAGKALTVNKDIVLELWDQSVDPNNAVTLGYSVMNSSFYPTYYVQGWESYNRPQYAPFSLYEQWSPLTWFKEELGATPTVDTPIWTLPNNGNPQLLGGKLQVWSDNPTIETEVQVSGGIFEKLRAMAQNNWGSPKIYPDYLTFSSLITRVGKAPGTP